MGVFMPLIYEGDGDYPVPGAQAALILTFVVLLWLAQATGFFFLGYWIAS